jgi:glycosyltransferase involved in cell wall biosynthesis
MKRNFYLAYPQGPHPAHIFQATAINASIVPYTKIFIQIDKRSDILISEGFYPLLVASQLKRLRLAKRHVNILLGDFIIGLNKYYFLKDFLDKMFEYCDAIIANSSFTAEIFQKYFGKKYAQRIGICWPLPDIKPFAEIPRFFLRKKLQNNHQELGICYLGHLTYYDGVDLLPRIFLSVKNELKRDLRMYVIGSGPLYKELSQIGKNLKGFYVLGYQPLNMVKEIFKKCQLFIYPARFKCFGLSVIEAMAAGLIPLVTERTGAKDFVKKLNSRLVVPLDVKTISNRIAEVLTMDPMLWRELSVKARQIAQSWDEKVAKETFLRLINKLLKT